MTKLIDITGKALAGEWGNDDETGTGIPVLRTTNFTNEGVVNYDSVVTRSITKKNIEDKFLCPGDIIIEKSGGSDKQPVGRVIFYEGPENTFLFNNFTGVLRVKDKSKWFSRYVFYSLYSNYRRGGTRAFENKTTGLHNLKTDDYVSRFEVVDANYCEQKSICNILDKATEIIRARQQQLSALDDLIKARFVEMFGDPLLNPMNWKEEKLEEIADIVSGITKGRKVQSTDLYEVPYMAVSNVKDGYIDWTTVKTILATQAEIDQYRLLPNDVLMTEGGDPDKLGRGAIIHEPPSDCIHQNHIFRVRLDQSRITPEFMGQYLQHQKAKRYFLGCAKQTTGIASINMKQLRALPMLMPPIGLQREFAAFVAQIDKSKFGEIRFLYTDYIYNKKYGDRKMDITFLIGNGFDIHMGIASAYKKVEAHYANLKKADPRLQAFQKSIAENGDYWSNFEFAIGQYTDRFQDDRQADFQICLDDFTEELIRYLQAEESKIDYDLCGEEIQKEFIRSISKYDESIPNRYRNTINAIISKNGGVNFRFISFNYTHILDQCLERAFKNNAVVGNHAMKGTGYNHIVNRSVLHIHGDLPGPIIMGVDNPGQIANKKWSGQRRFRQKLEKPAINARAGSLVDDEVTKLINGSNIICVYGMSIGETDKTWWKLIGSWLQGADRRLVLFGHSSSYSQVGFTHQRQFDIQNNLIDKFLDLAEIQGADRDALENKIIAVINPNLFNINLVQLSEQKKKVNEIETEAKVKELTAAYEKHKKLAELTTVT